METWAADLLATSLCQSFPRSNITADIWATEFGDLNQAQAEEAVRRIRRTFEHAPGRVWLGVGGGITTLSDPAAEVQECRDKAEPLLAAIGGRPAADVDAATGRHVEVLSLDHYLEVLTRKPGALPGATALAQAKAAGAFTPAHQRYWDAARRALGDGRGTRALVEVLLAHRTLPAAALTEAIDAAVIAGILAPEAVIIDARARAATAAAPPVPVGDALARYC